MRRSMTPRIVGNFIALSPILKPQPILPINTLANLSVLQERGLAFARERAVIIAGLAFLRCLASHDCIHLDFHQMIGAYETAHLDGLRRLGRGSGDDRENEIGRRAALSLLRSEDSAGESWSGCDFTKAQTEGLLSNGRLKLSPPGLTSVSFTRHRPHELRALMKAWDSRKFGNTWVAPEAADKSALLEDVKVLQLGYRFVVLT